MLGSIGDMRQECATVLPAVELVYVTYGTLAPVVMAALTSVEVDATYVEIDSEHGQLASGTDALSRVWAAQHCAFGIWQSRARQALPVKRC